MAQTAILILGNEHDERAHHTLAHLRGRGCDVEMIDSRWFPSRMTIAFDPRSCEGHLGLPGGRNLPWSQVRAVYWRSYDGVEVLPLPDSEQAWIAHNDSRSLFETI